MEHLKNQEVFIRTGMYINEKLGVDISKISFEEATIKAMRLGILNEMNHDVREMELRGIGDYAAQFCAFISIFLGGKAPYIIAGMQVALDQIKNTFDPVQMRKLEELEDLAGKCLNPTLVRFTHPMKGNNDD